MQQIWEQITELEAAGQPAALATLIATRGSTPRNVGTKMLVLSDGNIVGTLGGGCAEAEVWQAAMRVIKTKVPERLHLELIDDGTGLTTMICGRTLDVFIEPIAADVSKQSKDTLLLPTPDEGDDICHILAAQPVLVGWHLVGNTLDDNLAQVVVVMAIQEFG